MVEILNFKMNRQYHRQVSHFYREIDKVDMQANGGFSALGSEVRKPWLSYRETPDELVVEIDEVMALSMVDDTMRPFMFAFSITMASNAELIRCALLFMPKKYADVVPKGKAVVGYGLVSGTSNLAMFYLMTPTVDGYDGEVAYEGFVATWVNEVINNFNANEGYETHSYKTDYTYNAYKMAAVIALSAYAHYGEIDRISPSGHVYVVGVIPDATKKLVRLNVNGYDITLPGKFMLGHMIQTSSGENILGLKSPSSMAAPSNDGVTMNKILDIYPEYKPDNTMAMFLLSQAALLRNIAATYEIMAMMGKDDDDDDDDDGDDS